MPRYIDADTLDDVVQSLNEKNWGITRADYKMIDAVIFEFPTVDVKPVVRGKWTNKVKKEYMRQMDFWHCTNCGEDVEVPTCLGDPLYNFCPNCGADMRGERDG